MNRIIYPCFLVYALLLSLDSVSQTKHEPNDVITLEVDTMRNSYRKLLIAGFGTIPIRHFMENLSPQLINHYNKQQISGTYEFIGSKGATFHDNLNAAIQKHQPDVALIIYEYPEGPDTLVIKKQRQAGYLLISPARRQKVINPRNTKLKETLQAVLWEPATNKIIWRGELYISGNVALDNFFLMIAGLLTDELNRHNLLVAERKEISEIH